jgi:hypothetical protein
VDACTPPPLTVASVGLAAEPEGVAAVPREAVEPAQQELPGICRRAVIACSEWQPAAAAAAAQALTQTPAWHAVLVIQGPALRTARVSSRRSVAEAGLMLTRPHMLDAPRHSPHTYACI